VIAKENSPSLVGNARQARRSLRQSFAVLKRACRTGIQAKGYPSENSVGNAAIQDVFTYKTVYKTDICAVITIFRFTRHARDARVSRL
jgi:HJR/Mrr/RecB family endonuclease